MSTQRTSSAGTGDHVDIAIIGAGFSGLGMAIRLRQAGHADFTLLERHPDVGGTWWANTYPGCTCDVPSHLYSFSFAPNPDWSHTYSPQSEIRAYLERCARDFDLYRSIRLGTTVEAATWDEQRGCWALDTSAGTLTARVLIAGMGPLTEPRIPAIPGIDRFAGKLFHSATWDHDRGMGGERVAAVGTGASAIQFVPAIQPRVGRLHVFQRTAPWVVPHTNRRIGATERRLYRAVPALQKAIRAGVYVGREALVPGFAKDPRLMRVVERVARRHIRAQVPDRELRARVMPDYTIGCKRILPSNDWYPALGKPNVELVTDAITEIGEHSVVTADGSERAVDTIVLGTGFKVTDMPIGEWVRGRGGKRLIDAWDGSPRAHLGTTIAGFPNLFVLLGPNTGLGHSSMVYMIESQLEHVLGALRAMRERGAATVEVRPEAQAAYNRDIDARMERTVWSTGCASWYIDATGRNATIWPDWTWRFRRRTRRFDPAEYELRPAAVPAPTAVPA
jgi:cation diffusion facilitator CzcD-associated flavoprotein CzcO